MKLFKTKFQTGLVALGLVAMAGLAACGADEGEVVADDGSVTIATIAPMSGPSAVYGESQVAMIEHLFDEANADGGVEIAGEKHKLKLKVYNDEGTPQGAQAVARDAMDEGRKFVIGPFNSGSTSAIQSEMAKSDAFWLLNSAIVDGPTKNPNVFRTAARIQAYNQPTIDYLKAHPEIKRVATITDQTHTAMMSSQDQFVKDIEALGREVVIEQSMKLGDTEFRAPVSEVIKSDVDLYVLRVNPTEAGLITKQMDELGGTVQLQWSATITNADTKVMFPDTSLMDGVLRAAPATSLDTLIVQGNERAKALDAELGAKSGGYGAFNHDAVQILFKAFAKAEDPSVEAVIKAMTELTAEDVADVTLNTYAGQDGGLVFKDREVDFKGEMAVYKDGTGWILAD
ncbi:ABC-type branched-subunit amino acid transport system substrate-binding protein [Nocardioides daedukensis]|uniref:ABC-type branched-subunit amino acid transport system substrate-binding protein n=1 Tax=Nocardioides daedukensis TaxID=634462 RepID=A0A7Y9S056_9ACTN|nr:ABC transporter substrate-binding protein [Nocardioides daedukensis]NYG59841.1 ABC-type branched-subunit amino acid transport system substrate-binding protein [Nocardioides daedukensis]